MDISIILPVQNQEEHIGLVVRQYLQELDNLHASVEVLIVINGPRRDHTLRICEALSEGRPDVRVLVEDQTGWGRAVRLGLSDATGDLLCYANSARTSATDLALLITRAMAEKDCVIKANRKRRANLWRRLGSLLYNLECRALFGLSNSDINGTPKVFPRTFSKLLELRYDDDLIDLEFHVVCRRENYRILDVPTFRSSVRRSGRTTTTWRSAVGMYGGAVQMWRAERSG
jgi:glycosyltransferase involved in cell wall biosynthesis